MVYFPCITSKEDISYRITIGDIHRCTCLDLTNVSSHGLDKEGIGFTANIFIMCLDLCARWIR